VPCCEWLSGRGWARQLAELEQALEFRDIAAQAGEAQDLKMPRLATHWHGLDDWDTCPVEVHYR
jgi:hypothetical protein